MTGISECRPRSSAAMPVKRRWPIRRECVDRVLVPSRAIGSSRCHPVGSRTSRRSAGAVHPRPVPAGLPARRRSRRDARARPFARGRRIVSLHLRDGERPFGHGAVVEPYRVPRVLPALNIQALGARRWNSTNMSPSRSTLSSSHRIAILAGCSSSPANSASPLHRHTSDSRFRKSSVESTEP